METLTKALDPAAVAAIDREIAAKRAELDECKKALAVVRENISLYHAQIARIEAAKREAVRRADEEFQKAKRALESGLSQSSPFLFFSASTRSGLGDEDQNK